MHNQTISPRSRPAFTLIEMMLVVLVVGIFAALAAPFVGSASQSQLPAATRMLEADLAFAQAHAIAHQDDPCVIVFDNRANQYFLALSSKPEVPITHPGDKRPYIMKFGEGRASNLSRIRIKKLDIGDDNQLAFGSFGQLDQTEPARIVLGDDTSNMMITLDPITGLATITRE